MTALLVLLVALAVPAGADQTDERLDRLFDRLEASQNETEAELLEKAIWRIWQRPKTASVRVLMRVGIQDMNEGRYKSAEQNFSAAIEFEPEFAEAWNKRATVRYLMNDLVGSVEDIKRTLVLEERHFGALSGLGLIYDALDQKEAAVQAFGAALKIHPHLKIRNRMEELVEEIEGTPL